MSTAAPPTPPSAPGGPDATGLDARAGTRPIALLGNPNTGKTTLFNRLTGLRHKTSNFPGTTLEARVGLASTAGEPLPIIDLPGIYSLELDALESEVCRAVLAGRVAPRGQPVEEPGALCVVADATNLPRSLTLVGEALRRRLPTVVALNMTDLARSRGVSIDTAQLSASLGVPVVPICARSGEGVDRLRVALADPKVSNITPPGDTEATRAWADDLYARVASATGDAVARAESFTDRLDRAFTHPVLGLGLFLGIMAGLFFLLFTIAAYPMDLIDSVFGWLKTTVAGILPAGAINELITSGIIAGIGSTVIFLPQICLLFFIIALLEDTGYLARAAFVADRLLRPFGLPGHSFVPLLSSHACALPGIMATRTIPDRRERLATILVAPFMSCSARLPVYALLTTILFYDRPLMAALAFIGCYALGALAAIFSALIARRTILKGDARPMALELPSYKRPSLRTALVTTLDRAAVFIKKAGTVILAISIVLWWLSSHPKVDPTPEVNAKNAQIEETIRLGLPLDSMVGKPPREWPTATLEALSARVDELEAERDHLQSKAQQAGSFAGQIGKLIQPALAPMGADWQLSIGIVTSFAAREVFVSTLAVVVAGEEDAEAEGVLDQLRTATRDDGVTPVFTTAVCWALLVYYVLAMQCLPTLAVTARESGSVKWALLQLVWMCGLAYVAATAVYQALR